MGFTINFFLGMSTLALEKGWIPFLRRTSSRDNMGLVPGTRDDGYIAGYEVGLASWAMRGFKGGSLYVSSKEEIC